MGRPGLVVGRAAFLMTNEVLKSLFDDAIKLFPEDIARINGVDWNVVRASSQAGASGGIGGLWDTYAFSITGVKPAAGTVPAAKSRLTYNRATYQIAGVEQVGTTDVYIIHLSNPQRPN